MLVECTGSSLRADALSTVGKRPFCIRVYAHFPGWHAHHRPWLNKRLKKLLPTLPAGVEAIAWKAQERLHKKFTKMTYRGKNAGTVATAVARELAGFVWAIGTLVESKQTADNKVQVA